MTEYRVLAIPESTAEAVRSTLASPQYGHPAHVELAQGYGPCRLCLRFFAVGQERRILFTYDPFEETGASPLPGPVFIHETACDRYPEVAYLHVRDTEAGCFDLRIERAAEPADAG